jgi:hypothetical protein
VERKPMLARMPLNADAGAEEIIQLARSGVTDDLLGCLVTRDFAALVWYSARQVVMALREGSHERLRCALLAEAIFFEAGREPDDRMLMVSMAVHYYVAEQIGLAPADLFAEIASYLPEGPWADLIRWFGTRDDVTLPAFAWQLVETPDGPDFMSTL